MRIMGLDFGAKTVGVAISDPLLLTAQGIEIIRRKDEDKQRRTLARIEELIKEYEVNEIVLGMPYNMDDPDDTSNPLTYGERGEKTLAFKEKLERRSGLKVTLWDERLTTFEAIETMNELGIKKEKHKNYVDMIAAVLILQGYLYGKNSV
ncbi:MAG: Holliday junction resolvase RuvX [Lachnospiraceae bacterium]|nr:Holliday junction resolvase RuvX [Lachnospiraceae bacterium]